MVVAVAQAVEEELEPRVRRQPGKTAGYYPIIRYSARTGGLLPHIDRPVPGLS